MIVSNFQGIARRIAVGHDDSYEMIFSTYNISPVAHHRGDRIRYTERDCSVISKYGLESAGEGVFVLPRLLLGRNIRFLGQIFPKHASNRSPHAHSFPFPNEAYDFLAETDPPQRVWPGSTRTFAAKKEMVPSLIFESQQFLSISFTLDSS
jgi:hypothetical protein